MNDISKNSAALGDIFVEAVRQAFEGVMRSDSAALDSQANEKLLSVKEAAEILNVSADWLYRNAKRLPFSRKLGPKMLRFSNQGLQKYITTMRPAS
jgi:excisionase family DNA binding protein